MALDVISMGRVKVPVVLWNTLEFCRNTLFCEYYFVISFPISSRFQKVHPYLATGLASSKFGIEDEQISDAIDVIKASKYLCLYGIHCHIGSSIEDINVYK